MGGHFLPKNTDVSFASGGCDRALRAAGTGLARRAGAGDAPGHTAPSRAGAPQGRPRHSPQGRGDGSDRQRKKGKEGSGTARHTHPPRLGLQPALLAGLERLSIGRPTAVQRLAIPALRRGRSALCAAETGSGKTLAYLLPLLERLLGRPEAPAEAAGPAAPRGLVVLPSRELAAQVGAVAAALCAPAGLAVRGLTGGGAAGGLRRQLRAPPPGPAVLLGTPGALREALRRRFLGLERLRWMVLDEADTLMDESFTETQVVVVGATFPAGLSETLAKFTDVDRFVTLSTQSLHRLPPHVQQKFVRLKGRDKLPELLLLLKERPASGGAVLIFCNSASTVNWLGYILDDHKIKHLRLQGQMSAAARAGIFASFQKGEVSVLVCTDLASRGLDTSSVQLVVNYDFPDTLQDYLHRAGRVGRVGSRAPGAVVSFVTHRILALISVAVICHNPFF
uniref:DEAD-box helicase 28 n=1 Tax=Catharus ustulatus TaxID=91951 RepID=A0A8C3Y579_CATUS